MTYVSNSTNKQTLLTLKNYDYENDYCFARPIRQHDERAYPGRRDIAQAGNGYLFGHTVEPEQGYRDTSYKRHYPYMVIN